MSKLEPVVLSLVELFQDYSGREEKKGQLSPKEFKELLQKELSLPELKVSVRPPSTPLVGRVRVRGAYFYDVFCDMLDTERDS